MIDCKCNLVARIEGNEAEQYAKSHLVEIEKDHINWKTLYRCPTTGKYWKEYFPYGYAQAGGPPELVQVSAVQADDEFGLAAH